MRVNVGSETTKEVTAGALPGFNTNVFIDGVSYKNDVLLGGVVGQDSSRGNPFPQNAVQEFRVLTQNFKAEFEKASSAAITAVTKSGGNIVDRRRVPPLPGQEPGRRRTPSPRSAARRSRPTSASRAGSAWAGPSSPTR